MVWKVCFLLLILLCGATLSDAALIISDSEASISQHSPTSDVITIQDEDEEMQNVFNYPAKPSSNGYPDIDDFIRQEVHLAHDRNMTHQELGLPDDGSVLIEGDSLTMMEPTISRAAWSRSFRKWHKIGSKYVMPFTFYEMSASAQVSIQWGMDYISQNTNFQFVKRTTEEEYVRIFPGEGCWSYLGMLTPASAMQTMGRLGQGMSLGTGCVFMRMIVHEIGHAMGLHHEHQRDDRYEHFITAPNQPIIGTLTKATPYEAFSVMHYSGGRMRDPILNQIAQYRRSFLTSCDLFAINTMYPGDIKPPTCVVNYVDDFLVASDVMIIRFGRAQADWRCRFGNLTLFDSDLCVLRNHASFPPALK